MDQQDNSRKQDLSSGVVTLSCQHLFDVCDISLPVTVLIIINSKDSTFNHAQCLSNTQAGGTKFIQFHII